MALEGLAHTTIETTNLLAQTAYQVGTNKGGAKPGAAQPT